MFGGQPNGGRVPTVPALNLFQRRGTQEAVEREYTVEYRPSEQYTDDRSPVIFNIPRQSRDLTDLRNCSMKMKFKVKHKDDDTAIEDGEQVALINMIHQTAWSQMDVTIQGVPVSSSTRMYPYKAFFKTLTRGAGVAEDSAMKSMGWCSPYTGNNDSRYDSTWLAGKRLIDGNRLLEMEGPLMEDIFESERYLLNGTDMQVKLHRNLSPFMLYVRQYDAELFTRANLDMLRTRSAAAKTAYEADEDDEGLKAKAVEALHLFNHVNGVTKGYKIVLDSIVLKMAYVRVAPQIVTAIQESLQESAALYPHTRTEMKTVAIPSGQQQVYFDTVFSGLRPSKIVLAFVSSEAVNGSLGTDALNLEAHKVSDVSITVDGTVVQPKKLSYDENNKPKEYVSAYMDYMAMVKRSGYETPNVTPEEFMRHPIFTFCLEPTISGDFQHQTMKGPVSVNARFDQPLEQSVNLMLYAEIPGLMQIDAARNVTIN